MDFFRKLSQFILFIIFILSIGLNVYFLNREEKIETIYKEKIDTIRDTVPQIKKEKVVSVIKDTVSYVTTNYDTVLIERELPLTQKEYSDDSTYVAWVSGYKPKLDSIHTYQKTVTIERTIYTTQKKTFWSNFNVGVGVYGGYGLTTKKPDVFIGGGIQYKLK